MWVTGTDIARFRAASTTPCSTQSVSVPGFVTKTISCGRELPQSVVGGLQRIVRAGLAARLIPAPASAADGLVEVRAGIGVLGLVTCPAREPRADRRRDHEHLDRSSGGVAGELGGERRVDAALVGDHEHPVAAVGGRRPERRPQPAAPTSGDRMGCALRHARPRSRRAPPDPRGRRSSQAQTPSFRRDEEHEPDAEEHDDDRDRHQLDAGRVVLHRSPPSLSSPTRRARYSSTRLLERALELALRVEVLEARDRRRDLCPHLRERAADRPGPRSRMPADARRAVERVLDLRHVGLEVGRELVDRVLGLLARLRYRACRGRRGRR